MSDEKDREFERDLARIERAKQHGRWQFVRWIGLFCNYLGFLFSLLWAREAGPTPWKSGQRAGARHHIGSDHPCCFDRRMVRLEGAPRTRTDHH